MTKLIADGPAFTDTLQSDIQTLQATGKNVLISVGGAINKHGPGMLAGTSAKHKIFNDHIPGLVGQIVSWVEDTGANGVDIDFEGSNAFAGKAGYDVSNRLNG